jgi:hypothetical protein
MKKIYYSLMLALSMLFTFTSCDMDKAPYGSLDENIAIQNLNDIARYRTIFYTNLRALTNGDYIAIPELQMDGFHGVIGNGNRQGIISNGLIEPSTEEMEDIWGGIYGSIANANYGIAKMQQMIESGEYTDNDLAMLKRYQGEGYFLRAFCYFYLADHFCPAYTSANAETAALGLPLQLVYAPSGDVSTYPGRSTLKETYNQIETDLNAAYQALSAYEAIDASQVAAEAPYLSSYAVLAFQARVALQKKDYATALSKAEQVINSGKYELTDIADYAAMWTDDKGKEIIFRPFASKDELPGSIGTNFLNDAETFADYIPTFDMLVLYGADDVRFDAFFKVYSSMDVEGQKVAAYVFNKFPGNATLRTTAANNLRNMAKAIRLSEVYLIAAEAADANNDATKANKYLNDLRSKRIADYAAETLSGSGLTQAIRSERQKELIGEGFRMGDLRRWGLGFQRNPIHSENPVLNDLVVKAGANLTYPADDHRFTWPIPTAELDANPNIKGQQNAGY